MMEREKIAGRKIDGRAHNARVPAQIASVGRT